MIDHVKSYGRILLFIITRFKSYYIITVLGWFLLLLLLFLKFNILVANPKKLLYTVVANPARGLLKREIEQNKKSGSALPPTPPPPTLLVRRK